MPVGPDLSQPHPRHPCPPPSWPAGCHAGPSGRPVLEGFTLNLAPNLMLTRAYLPAAAVSVRRQHLTLADIDRGGVLHVGGRV